MEKDAANTSLTYFVHSYTNCIYRGGYYNNARIPNKLNGYAYF